MKWLAMILLAVAGFFAWQKFHGPGLGGGGANLVAQIQSGQGVTVEEAKVKAHEVATSLCNESEYQRQLGSSTESCLQFYRDTSATCERVVFGNITAGIHSEEKLKSLLKSFVVCVTRV